MSVPGEMQPWLPVVAASVAMSPLAYAVYRARVRHDADPRARRRAAAEVAMVAGTLPWLWMILTPTPADGELQLVPVVDLVAVLTAGGLTAVLQVGGNLLAFATFGFFAPRRWPIGVREVTALAATTSLLVETLQHTLSLGRVTSTDDILLNTAGATLTALLSLHASRRPGVASHDDRRTASP